MLKKFSLRNYKNFKDNICIDFENIAGYQFSTDCIADNKITKMLIYGRNATGKTNLGKAVMDIKTSMLGDILYADDENYLNADSKENYAAFSYTFQFDDKELTYKYTKFSNQGLRDEELIVDKIAIFKCNFENREYDYDNLKYISAETAHIQRYIQSLDPDGENEEMMESRLPFLRWLISNVAFEKDSALIRLSDYVKRMAMITAGNSMGNALMRMRPSFFQFLDNREKLKDLEDFLNMMGIECRLVLKKLPDDRRELYFAHDRLVPFYGSASSGTLALVDLYRRIISLAWDSSFIYLDEFDAFYHYEMAENVIKYLKKKFPKCQIIMTSHNTNLMTNRIMRPDCLFILSRTGTLTALSNATLRELREGHNLEKMYISGEFEQYE